jgi:hypothetical protein
MRRSSRCVNHQINYNYAIESGLGSSVSIVAGYGLDGPEIESRWGARFSAPVQTGPRAHPPSCKMGTGSFPGVKSGRAVTLTPRPLLVPLVMKEYSYISTPPMGRTASGLYTHVVTGSYLGNGRSPYGHINQRLQIQFRAPDDERCAARNVLSL